MRAMWGLVVFVAAALGICDGKFISHLSEKPPDMPYQRAFIAFDKGQETMIVESFMTGKKGDYVWLVPTPSQPDEVKPCHPHALSGLIETVSPRIEDSITREPFNVIMALAFSFFYFLTFALYFLNVRNQQRRFKFIYAFFLSLLVLVGCAILFPVFAQAKPGTRESGPAVASGTAGNYAYTVLSSKEPVEVLLWLARNGFKLDTQTKEAVAKNSQKGCFLTVLRYKHPADGQAAPHPVRFTFKTIQPVYPMEMTGSGLSRLRLDLVVSMNQQAEVAGMRTVSASDFFRFGHPDVKPFAVGKGVVTFLRGDLNQSEMNDDMAIASKPFKDTYHERWADKGTFLGRIVFNILFLLPIAYLVLSILHAIKPRDAKWWRQAFAISIVACLVAVPTYGLLKYRLIDSEPGLKRVEALIRYSRAKTAVENLGGQPVQYPFEQGVYNKLGKDMVGDDTGQCLVEPGKEGVLLFVFRRDYRYDVYLVSDQNGVYRVEKGNDPYRVN